MRVPYYIVRVTTKFDDCTKISDRRLQGYKAALNWFSYIKQRKLCGRLIDSAELIKVCATTHNYAVMEIIERIESK